MTARAANIKGIKFLEEPNGADKGGVALVSFDLLNTIYTATSDTVTLGGAGYENGVSTTDTLATMIQNRRRDGKTVTITGVAAASVSPGRQAAATNGPLLYARLAAVSGGNLGSITLFNALLTGGSECTCTAAAWDQAATLAVTYKAV
jgi:hypothetical protein